MKLFTKAILIVILTLVPGRSSAQDGLLGNEFWCTFMENAYTPPDSSLLLNITPYTKDTVTVFNPQLNVSYTFEVKPGTQNIVRVPKNIWYSPLAFGLQGTGVRVSSNRKMGVIAVNGISASAAATSLLPVSIFQNAREYYINAYGGDLGKETQIAILATDTGTTKVQVFVTGDLVTGQGAGSTVTRNLKQGQVWVLLALADEDLSGSRIQVIGQCKKIAVFEGVKCAKIPNSTTCSGCDALYAQVYPAPLLGSTYFCPLPPENGNYRVRVVAKFNGTKIYINGTEVKSLNQSQVWDTVLTVSAQVSGNKAFACTQLLQSSGCNGAVSGYGDPSLLQLTDSSGAVKSAAFSVYRKNGYKHHLVLVSQQYTQPKIFLNGSLVVSTYTKITSNSVPYWVCSLQTTPNNTYFLNADTGFIAYLYGMATSESYTVALSGNFSNKNFDFEFSPNPVCNPSEFVQFQAKGDSISSLTWLFDNGATKTGNSVVHQFNKRGIFEVKLINSGSGYCNDTVTKEVNILGLPESVLPNDTGFCDGNVLRIELPQSSAINYQWENGSTSWFRSFTQTGKYFLLVTDSNQCQRKDTIDILFRDCDSSVIKLSNVFTPNQDGFNDKWVVYYSGYNEININIYNRWGALVYQYSLPNDEHWNGSVNNEFTECPEGSYFYQMKAVNKKKGKTESLSGTILLLR